MTFSGAKSNSSATRLYKRISLIILLMNPNITLMNLCFPALVINAINEFTSLFFGPVIDLPGLQFCLGELFELVHRPNYNYAAQYMNKSVKY